MSKKVLVVDDDKLARKGLTKVLEDAGMDVSEAVNGKEGLEKALKEKPDLIVTDVHMPQMDGLQMIEELRADEEWGKSVPVVVLTVDDATTSINQALAAGVTFYLTKTGMTPDAIADQVVVAVG